MVSVIKGSVSDILSSSQNNSYFDITSSNKKTDEKEKYVGNRMYYFNQFESDSRLDMKVVVNLELYVGNLHLTIIYILEKRCIWEILIILK